MLSRLLDGRKDSVLRSLANFILRSHMYESAVDVTLADRDGMRDCLSDLSKQLTAMFLAEAFVTTAGSVAVPRSDSLGAPEQEWKHCC